MFLGIDLGTGSVKALLVDRSGGVVAEASRTYPVLSPVPGYAEASTDVWWAATVAAVQECCAGRSKLVEGVGLSGQAHGVVVLDSQDRPIRPAILWADQRARAQMVEVLSLPEALRLPLANPVVTGMAGLSLMWLRDNEPATFNAVRHALSPKDWLRFVMTGEIATEPSDASMTLLYDIAADQWSTDFIRALGIAPDVLPPVVASESVAGRLSQRAAEVLRLRPGLPVGAGLSDTAACLFGMGQIAPGSTILQIGSGIQIMTVVDRIVPRIQPFYNSFRGVGGTAYLMAALQNGGTVFEWVRRILGASWTEMYQGAFESGEGNGGIVSLPYAAGERAPLLDPAATAVWAYMKLGCTRNQIIRSVFEGVALAVRDSWDALTNEGITAPSMLLTGGGSADPRWRQMLASILQVPLVPALDIGNATLGAGYIGGIAAGHWRCAGEVPFASRSEVIIMPQICNGLDQRLERFRATYQALKQI